MYSACSVVHPASSSESPLVMHQNPKTKEEPTAEDLRISGQILNREPEVLAGSPSSVNE